MSQDACTQAKNAGMLWSSALTCRERSAAILMTQPRAAYSAEVQNLVHTSTKKTWKSKLTDSWFALQQNLAHTCTAMLSLECLYLANKFVPMRL